jgi:hypothetical protein
VGDWPYIIRHHWIALLRPPGRGTWIVFGLLVLFVLVGGLLAWIPLLVVLAVFFGLRYREWRADLIELNPRTIRHARGVKETTATNAFLRIDRITGVAMSQTVPGKLLGYATLHIEASGDHPDFRRLVNIENSKQTFVLLEALMFDGEVADTDPDDTGFDAPRSDNSNDDFGDADTTDAVRTAPLPELAEEPETALPIYRWRP